MADYAGQGCKDGNSTVTSTSYTYIEHSIPATGAGLVTEICIDIDTNNNTLKIGCGSISGTTVTPRNYVEIDTTGLGTGVKTFTAPDDFTAFAIEAGDIIMVLSDASYGQYGRSDNGSPNKYGYASNDQFDQPSFTISENTTKFIEVRFTISPAVTYKLKGHTYDKNGDVLGSCKCYLLKKEANVLTYKDYLISDAGTGVYQFEDMADNEAKYLVAALKTGTPNRFDVTFHTCLPKETPDTDYDLYLRSDADKGESELAIIQAAVNKMMVDNQISELKHPVLEGNATNNMGAFPDNSICGVDKLKDPNGYSYIFLADKDGYYLWQHDIIADGLIVDLVNYVSSQYTTNTYYTDSTGAVYQKTGQPSTNLRLRTQADKEAAPPVEVTQYLSGNDLPIFPHEQDIESDKLPCPNY